jgi:hypothetical protein
MNIFVLDKDPVKAAQAHCDKHVVKMILETAQLLSTADHVAGRSTEFTHTYKPTHKNHPCAVWVREEMRNYQWLCELGLALCAEYSYRYAKHRDSLQPQHACEDMIQQRTDWVYYTYGGLANPASWALAMPDQYKGADPVAAYRAYYIGEKARMLTYKRRSRPTWIPETALCVTA